MTSAEISAPARQPLLLWAAWAVVLLSSPVFGRELWPESSAYTYCAFGMLVGLAASLCLSRRVTWVLCAVGLTVTLIIHFGQLCFDLMTSVSAFPPAQALVITYAFLAEHLGSSILALVMGLGCGTCLRPCVARACGEECLDVAAAPLALACGVLAGAALLRPWSWSCLRLLDVPALVHWPLAMLLLALSLIVSWGVVRMLMVCSPAAAPLARLAPDSLAVLLLAAPCAGELAAKWLMHVTGLTVLDLFDLPFEGSTPAAVGGTFALVLLLVSVAALVVLPWLVAHLASRRRSAPGEAVASSAEETGLEALLARGLTVREAQAMRALLDGLSSREASVALGLSASTVRNYQQRAYKKLGVADAREACELLAGEVDDAGVCVREDADAPVGPSPARKAGRLAAVALAALLLVPFGQGDGSAGNAWWVSGQLAVCAAGGFVLLAGVLAVRAARERGVVVMGTDTRPRGNLALRIAAAAAAVVAVGCRVALALGLGAPDVSAQTLRLVCAVALPTLVVTCGLRAARALNCRPGAAPLVARAALGFP